jgi:hypothetical protein
MSKRGGYAWLVIVGFGLFCWLFVVPNVYADPAPPDLHTLQQPDGTKFQARLWGDEWVHGWETPDGYTILKDLKTGIWFYAEQGPQGNLVATGAVVGRDQPVTKSQGARPSSKLVARNLSKFVRPSIIVPQLGES